MEIVIVLLIVGGAIYLIYRDFASRGSLIGGHIPVSEVISHWSHFFREFKVSSDMFYTELEKNIQTHAMPHTELQRVTHKEGGMLSASRVYFRIKHGDIVFDICASPFGNDFFISWWLYETAGPLRTLLKRTKVGDFLNARAAKRTFYQIDEEEMFRSCAHECILETITKVSEGKGFTQLTDAQKAFKMGGV